MGKQAILCSFTKENASSSIIHTSFKRDAEEFLGFDGKFHREFVDDFLGISVDDEVDSGLCRDATLVAIEELVFRDFRRGGFVFHNGIGLLTSM